MMGTHGGYGAPFDWQNDPEYADPVRDPLADADDANKAAKEGCLGLAAVLAGILVAGTPLSDRLADREQS